jgi:hypothetical protein
MWAWQLIKRKNIKVSNWMDERVVFRKDGWIADG